MPFLMADGSDGRNDHRARAGLGGPTEDQNKSEEHQKDVVTPSSCHEPTLRTLQRLPRVLRSR